MGEACLARDGREGERVVGKGMSRSRGSGLRVNVNGHTIVAVRGRVGDVIVQSACYSMEGYSMRGVSYVELGRCKQKVQPAVGFAMQNSAAMPCGGVCLNIFRHLVFEFMNGMTNLDSENGILRVGVHILLLRVFLLRLQHVMKDVGVAPQPRSTMPTVIELMQEFRCDT